MSEKITLVFDTSVYTNDSGPWQGAAKVWVNPGKQASSPDYATAYNSKTENWALVLDRKDPTKPPLFNSRISSNTDAPDNLKTLMTPAHILLYMAAGYGAAIPQGNLFTMLQQNGAGARLQKLERFAYFNGCGMTVPSLYTLVSVPGSNLPGIEHITSAKTGSSYYPDHKTYVYTAGTLASLISLIPGTDGYAPVEIG
ncbi:MAG: hypothetical protein WBB25_05220 [Sulfitobacter sp.]